MDEKGQRPSYAELAALVVQLQAEVARLTKRIEELEKKNPTQRLDKSYSMKADEQRRREDEEKKLGTPRKHGSSGDRQNSERRGRIPC